ncbi:MAG: hypothetical protein HXY38_08905 [Chloroflexi bacterium]|nr:hypothetical protein [Chloroflexota bacterium]
MASKTLFQRSLLVLGLLLLTSGVTLPGYYNLPYPAPLDPRFEAGVKQEHVVGIEESRPDFVLIGDSVLYEGVDPTILSQESGAAVYSIPVPGSGTAAWYLVLKNVILESSHRPRYVVILFRNTMLTVPQYRTTGRYFELLDDYATRNEPLLAQLAFIQQMSPAEKFAARYIPLYSARLEIREDLDNLLRYKIPNVLTGCDRACVDESVGAMFGREVNLSALNQRMEDAAQTLYDPAEMNFEKQVAGSFLPHLIELTRQNGVTLILVRTKIIHNEPLELEEYNAALEAYLGGYEHVTLLDYSTDPRFSQAEYVDSLHMNADGRKKFSKILAGEFREILSR